MTILHQLNELSSWTTHITDPTRNKQADQMPSTSSFSTLLITSWIFPFRSSQGFSWIGEYCLNRRPSPPTCFFHKLPPNAMIIFRQGWKQMMKMQPTQANKLPITNTRHRNRTRVTMSTNKSLNSFLLSAKPNLFLEQSNTTQCFLKTGSPRITRLLKVFLMFRISFFLETPSQVRSERGRLMLRPPKSKKITFSSTFSNLCLEEEVHSTKQVLLLMMQVTSFSISFFMMVVITDSGRPMQDALRVKTAVSYSTVSSSLSSSLSSIPMYDSRGSRPNPSSSGMSIHWISLKPDSTYLAVMSPIVIVWFQPRQIPTIFSVAFTQLKISFMKEFSEVWSNRIEMAPSLRSLRLGLISVALMKLVFSSWSRSCSPQMKRPSMMSSKKLVIRLESLATKDTFLPFSTSPRMISEEPSMMAFSVRSFFFFLCIFLAILCLTSLTSSTKVSSTLEQVLLEPSILHSLLLIQLMGAVKSTAMEMCCSCMMKGMEQLISFWQQISRYSAS